MQINFLFCKAKTIIFCKNLAYFAKKTNIAVFRSSLLYSRVPPKVRSHSGANNKAFLQKPQMNLTF